MRSKPRKFRRPYPFGWQFRGCGNMDRPSEGVDMVKKKEETHEIKGSGDIKGHANLFPYPTDLGTPAGILLSSLNGESEVDRNCMIHAAVQIQCVAMGHLFPDDHTRDPVGSVPVTAEVPSDEEAKGLLQEATMKRGPITDMILQKLLAWAISKINEWLNK